MADIKNCGHTTYPVASKGVTQVQAVADCVAKVDAQVYGNVSGTIPLREYSERTFAGHGYDEVDIYAK